MTATAMPVVTATLDVRRLPGWRRQLGLTQQQLAKQAGIRSDDLSRLERFLAPGEHLDRVLDALTEAQADSGPQK